MQRVEFCYIFFYGSPGLNDIACVVIQVDGFRNSHYEKIEDVVVAAVAFTCPLRSTEQGGEGVDGG